MSTYYGYIERDADTGVNWQEISENVTTKLKEAGEAREARKKAIFDASAEYQKTLNDAPSGDYASANQFALEHADQAQQARLLQDRLLQEGLLSTKAYTVQRQNLTDGTKQLFDLSKEYQEEYSAKIERSKNGEAQELEGWLMGQIEGLANLRNTGSYINPETGAVSIGKMVEVDGVRQLSKDPNDFLTVNQLRNRQKQQYDVFKVGATMEAEADRLGSFITSVRQAGGPEYAGQITKMLDATLRGKLTEDQKNAVDNFEKMEQDMINSYIEANPLNALSVLTNYVTINPDTGKRYELTFDKNKAYTDDNFILVQDDGSGSITPDLSPKQKEVAFKAVQTNFRNQIDKEETVSTYNEPQKSATTEASDKAKKLEETSLSSWNDIAYGTPEEKVTAINNLLGSQKAQQSGLIAIDTTSPGVIDFVYSDETKNRTINYDPNNITITEWAQLGNEVHGIDDVSTVLQRAGGVRFVEDADGNRVPAPLDFSAESMQDVFATRTGKIETETSTAAYTRMLEEGIPDVDFSQEEMPSEAVETYFKNNPPPFGVEINDVPEGRNNTVKVFVTNKDGRRVSKKFDVTTPGAMQEIRDYILSTQDKESIALNPALQRQNISFTPRSRQQVSQAGGVNANPNVVDTSRYNK